MANEDKTEGSPVTSLEDWRKQKGLKEDKPKEPLPPPRKLVKLRPLPFYAELLKKVKEQEGGKTDPEVFLKALDRLCKLNELRANGGKLYVIFEEGDESAMPVDFDE